ncbi:3-phosphoshikimate 1-carboxyvinyltransferase [Clostridium aminobutyricum]|uniref:3-phosphoshikimate 1-carboxyvinyltransferase n=1 Tax=Clostridium aminobutyricum TaxID=33953 RepID=A0A939IKC3_CLOAM|nr:3-phosphoshikimate 1-carboxyvinyltransferase [Clostridium aminobutyricum]MBN7774493.1 3-phosphoshikimate 1-carboxyvinyltransferase [Clostridium aminobutyricum]
MNVKINPRPLSGTIHSITSKSHAHRLLIASALCKEPCMVHIKNTNEDLKATSDCLSSLNDEVPILNCQESGSTLRFLLPIAMVLKEKAVFLGSGRLPERPLSPLKEEMEAHGCTFEKQIISPAFSGEKETREIYTVSGRLRGGEFRLAGNVSSQYITGLLFALPLLEEDSKIIITSKLESVDYVILTLKVLETFGIHIDVQIKKEPSIEDKKAYTFDIRGNQSYRAPKEVTAEGDWSNAAFWVVAGALGGALRCENIIQDSFQGDKAVVDIVKSYHHKVKLEPTAVTTEKNRSISDTEEHIIDASNIPDLVPILSVLAASHKGTTRIINAGRLRIKESDRLLAVADCLQILGADVTELPDGLIIRGTGTLKGGRVSGYNDHRMVMSMAIASILCEEPVIINGAEAVNKSYPTFFEDFASLGGEYQLV